jgi:hypothetical protein
MPPRREKPIFKNITIAIAGDLGGQWSDTNITRWVTQREGTFSQQMDESATHLICSQDEFKKRGPRGEFEFCCLRREADRCVNVNLLPRTIQDPAAVDLLIISLSL